MASISTAMYVNAVKKHKIDILTHPGFRLDIDYKEIGKVCATYTNKRVAYRVVGYGKYLQALLTCGESVVGYASLTGKDLQQVQSNYPNLELLMGIEANVLGADGEIDVTEEDAKKYCALSAPLST